MEKMVRVQGAASESASLEVVQTLATQFPAVRVHKYLEELLCEVRLYRVDPVLPEVSYYKATDGVMGPRFGHF